MSAIVQTMDVVQIKNGTFSESDHVYKNAKGVIVPSVTQILESSGFSDYSRVPFDILDRKRRLGDATHFASAIIDRNKFFGQQDLDWDSVHEDCIPYVLAWERFEKETGFVPSAVEFPAVFSVNGLEFGVTIDRVGSFPGVKHRVVVELKCALEESVAWRFQTAAQAKATAEKDEFVGRCAVQLRDDATFRMSGFYESPRDWDTFYYSLFLTWVKINEGIVWRKDGNATKGVRERGPSL